MITGIDHVVIGVRDFDAGVAAYQRLLDRAPAHVDERDGVATALIATANAAVEIISPRGATVMAERLDAAITERGEGLLSVAFSVSDIERMHRRLDRVGLAPDDIGAVEAGALRWRRFRTDTQAAHGVRMFFLERAAPLGDSGDSGVLALDHIVVQTQDMDSAAALFGARLGLDMRLDRRIGDRRLMFFRCGDLVVEIAQAGEPRHRLWGLSWRVGDAAREQARLSGLGLDVSEVRAGLKPGTHVFSIRDKTCGVPTLMIETRAKRD